MLNAESNITVSDLVDSAIVEGFKNVGKLYVESLEDTLRRSIIIAEAGDAQAVLQEMIDSTEGNAIQEESATHLNQLEEKMSRILKK